MGYVFDWNGQERRKKLSQIANSAAYDLVSRLLSPKPEERSKESLQVLLENHPFFNPGSNNLNITGQLERMEQVVTDNNNMLAEVREEQDKQTALLLVIKDLSLESKVELLHTREALMKGIFEATEVKTPTTFIVLEELLPDPPSEEEKERLMLQIAKDGSVTVDGGSVSATFTEDGLVLKAAAGEYKEYVNHLNTGMKWASRLKTIGLNISADKVSDAFKTIKEGLGDLLTGKTMYLYLVDELTGDPVRAEGYPIKITEPSDVVPKLLPVMQVGLRAMSIFNGAAGIAQMIGYPVPKLPKAWTEGVRESVDLLKKKSSVEDFGVVQDVLDKEGAKKESDSVRGQSLRVFTDFLNENDPGLKANKSGHFAGLQRVPDPNSGAALWTTLTDPQEIKKALKARTSERKAEELLALKYSKIDEGGPKEGTGGAVGDGSGDGRDGGSKGVTSEAVATTELERPKADNEEQKQRVSSGNTEADQVLIYNL